MRRTLVRLFFGPIAFTIACVITGCTALGTTGPISGPYLKNIWGVDVSNYQHPNGAGIDWSAVRARGATFAFVKVSEGGSYTNPYAAADIPAARHAGLYVTGYHFARPRLPLSTAITDAQSFAQQLGNVLQPGYMAPVLDLETTGGLPAATVVAWTQAFLTALQAASGRFLMIYTGGWFWNGYLGDPLGFSQYPVWVAEYIPSQSGPDLFGDFTFSTFWQYGDTSTVTGITGDVDASWFHGTQAQFDSFAYVASSVNTSATSTTSTVSTRGHTGLARLPRTSPGSSAIGTGTTGLRMAQNPATVGSTRR